MASLNDLKPTDAWSPAKNVEWNFKWAAHLYRRAAFGFPATDGKTASQQLLDQAVKQGRDACVEQLLAGGDGQEDFNDLMDTLGGQIAKYTAPRFSPPEHEKLQGWWLYRMFHSPHPLLERCTLFWHNHFATSIAKVGKSHLMFVQNNLLRQHALDKFQPLLSGISHDPAMLLWLDSNSNIKGRPNENYAREIMELFSLGVGNYTETDIREAARSFTGWGAAGGKFVFNKSLHDDGEKTVLGETGNFDGDDVVRIIMQQPATARFLTRKLFREFVSEAQSPSDELLEPLAAQLRQTDFDIKACVATILRSNVFYSEHAYRCRIKSPVDYVIGLTRSFNANVSMKRLAESMDGLGQTLFAPPNVKGWDGGRAWLNSASLLARHNLAAKLVGGHDDEFPTVFHPQSLSKEQNPAEHVQELVRVLLQSDISDAAMQDLVDFASRPPKGKDQKERNTADKRLRELTHTILLMPEYQLA